MGGSHDTTTAKDRSPAKAHSGALSRPGTARRLRACGERLADQPSLLAARGDRRRRPLVEDLIPRVLSFLNDRGWVSARALRESLGIDERTLREVAHKSNGRIVGGQHGYCLTEQASLREVELVVRFLLGQAGRMRQRVIEIQRVRHAVDVPSAVDGDDA